MEELEEQRKKKEQPKCKMNRRRKKQRTRRLKQNKKKHNEVCKCDIDYKEKIESSKMWFVVDEPSAVSGSTIVLPI